MAKTKTTRNKKFNSFEYGSDYDKTIASVFSQKANNKYKNIKLLGVEDAVKVDGYDIIAHAAKNTTMKELGYDAEINVNEGMDDDHKIEDGTAYYIYGAPFQATLNNRQNYNNCGVESTLNILATAGIVKMKENLSDQKSVEKNFLKAVWNLGMVDDDGKIGVLDEADGGSFPDDYKNLFRQFDIESEAYFMTRKCDDIQYEDINKLAYKISQGCGAVVGVCSNRLWQEQTSETGEAKIDHAIALIGVVYADNGKHYTTDEWGNITSYDAPLGFYIHDSGAWMTRYISLEEFKEVTMYYEHGMEKNAADKYLYGYDPIDAADTANYVEDLRIYDSELRGFLGKKSGGIFVTVTSSPIKSEMFNLNATGDKQNNVIEGNNNDNVIKGMAGHDLLIGNAGDDELRGGSGNDTIIGNTLTDYDKNEFLEYLKKAGKNTDNLFKGVVTKNEYPEGINLLYGDAGNDVIFGGEDIDLIYGGSGNDYIYTGDGRNAAYGGSGHDVIVGGWHKDRLFGDAGNDYIYGLGDDDTIHGGAGNDIIYGGSGNDTIETGAGTDNIYFEGTEHGHDKISSQSGKTIFHFADEEFNGEVVSKAANASDMTFYFDQNENNKNLYTFQITYEEDANNANDSVRFDSFYNNKTGKAKALDIIDGEELTYKVSASKSSKIKTSGSNNILFSFRDKGATITTSKGNDIITMVETNDIYNLLSEYNSVHDNIKYTSGIDKYISEERNTYYTVDTFNVNTTLAIYDNVEALEKVVLDEHGQPIPKPGGTDPVTEKVVSTDDRLYLDCDKNKINFFFDVGLGQDGTVTTDVNGLFILNSLDSDTMVSISKDDDDISGYIYMDSFFKAASAFDGTDLYGNGRIETIFFDGGTPYVDLKDTLASIASDVASWLNIYNNDHAGYELNSAYDAFNHFDQLTGEEKATLVACYDLNS